MRILYDGWPLVHASDSPAALHLHTLLALAPEGTESLVALSTEPPADHSADSSLSADQGPRPIYQAKADLGVWQQQTLPRLAEEHGAALIHTTQPAASLFGRIPTLVSPSNYGSLPAAEQQPISRLKRAMGRGGLARACTLWPQDLPAPPLPGRLSPLPPVAHPAFKPAASDAPHGLELPDTYVLYHGPGEPRILLNLLESWTWAAASIGELYPLVLLGLEEGDKRFVEGELPKFHVEEHVQLLPRAHPSHLPAIYQRAAALAQPGPPAAWGDPIRHALACARPIVAFKSPPIEALVGQAGYLVEHGDLRAFGAAVITVVVDDEVRAGLESAAQKRSARWETGAFQSALDNLYQQAA